jgi:hypothetical protein
VSIPAGGSQCRSFDDRSNSRPTHHLTGAEPSRGPLIDALNWQARVFCASNSAPYHRVLDELPVLPNRNCRASDCHPRPASSSYIWNDVFEAFMYAAHVLRNHTLLLSPRSWTSCSNRHTRTSTESAALRSAVCCDCAMMAQSKRAAAGPLSSGPTHNGRLAGWIG